MEGGGDNTKDRDPIPGSQSKLSKMFFLFLKKLQFQSNTRVLVQSFSKDTHRTVGLLGQQHLAKEIKVPKASNKQSQGL